MNYLMGIDLGSTSIRAVVYDTKGEMVSTAARSSPSKTPDPAKPDEIIWPHEEIWETTCTVVKSALADIPKGGDVVAVAVACVGMEGLPIDKDGAELYPFISWAGPRTLPQFTNWLETFGVVRQFQATGNHLYPFNGLFRLLWMRENEPAIFAKIHKWVLYGDYINYRLSGILAADPSMASSTAMLDPATQTWSEDVLTAAGLSADLMCDIRPSGSVLGDVTKAASAATGLAEGTKVVLGGHDFLCGCLTVGGSKPGTVVNVGGTWDIIQTTLESYATPASMAGSGLAIGAHTNGGFSIYGGTINGAVTDWYFDLFGGAHKQDDEDLFAAMSDAIENGDPNLLFLPHIAGSSCPVVDPTSSGAFVGVKITHKRRDFLGAVVRGLSFQLRDILAKLEENDIRCDIFAIIGGSAKNDAINQAKADILQRPVSVPQVYEASALGAAMLAGVGAGIYRDLDHAYAEVKKGGRTYLPRAERAEKLQKSAQVFSKVYAALAEIHHDLAG